MNAQPLDDLRQRLEREHARQLEQFRRHQECLVRGDGHRALELLIEFENDLARHMELEERYVLPLCERDTVRPGHWGPHVYMQEHRRIRELLASVRMKLAGHCIGPGLPLAAADIIDLVDEERLVKNLISHHQTREETALYLGTFQEATV